MVISIAMLVYQRVFLGGLIPPWRGVASLHRSVDDLLGGFKYVPFPSLISLKSGATTPKNLGQD